MRKPSKTELWVKQLLKEARDLTSDPDRQQTLMLARLEGDDIETARKRASRRRASLEHTQSKDRGPRDVLGREVVLIDLTSFVWEHLTPTTLDTRTLEERKADIEREETVARLLDHLQPRQRQVMVRIYGLEDHLATSYKDISAELGIAVGTIKQVRHRSGVKLRNLGHDEP